MSLKSKLIKGMDWFCTFVYFFEMAIIENLSNPFKKLKEERNKPIKILGNGPSLKKFLVKMGEKPELLQKYDFIVVNDFVNNAMFEEIKPKYLTMSDPLFFEDTIYSERGHKAMEEIAKKVYWDMLFFMPYRYKNSKYLEPIKKNNRIKMIFVHGIEYRGRWLTSFALYLFSHGLGNGEFGTVVHYAIYEAIMLGYKEVHVHGIDHNYFANLAVNSQNVLCFKDEHFYEKESEWKPMMCHFGGELHNKPFTMAAYLRGQYGVFKGHLLIEQLAKSIGVKIYNCTPNSMVDAYERKIE